MTKQPDGFRYRLALAMLRLYPRAWRRRYETEQIALLAQRAPTWPTLLDLATAAVGEWLSPSTSSGTEALLRRVARGTAGGYLAAGFAACAARAVILLVGLVHFTFFSHQPIPTIGAVRLISGILTLVFGDVLLSSFISALFYLSYALVFTAPVALALKLTGAGRLWPRGSRILWVSAITAFQVWLMVGVRAIDVHVDIGVVVGGWVLSSALFPRSWPVSAPPVIAVAAS